MTATFSNTLATPLDRVRRNVGDTDVTAALRQDEEYLAVLARVGNDEAAATAEIAGGLAVEYAQRPVSISDEGTSINWGERVKTWTTLAEYMRTQTVAYSLAVAQSEQLSRFESTTGNEYDPDRW